MDQSLIVRYDRITPINFIDSSDSITGRLEMSIDAKKI